MKMAEEIETINFWKNISPQKPFTKVLSGTPVMWEEAKGALELDTRILGNQGLTKAPLMEYLESLFIKSQDRCPTDEEGEE
jgi:hypothetical protein